MKRSELKQIIIEEIQKKLTEQKISDITAEYLNNSATLKQASKEREDAQKKFNAAYYNAGKAGEELGRKFQMELAKELIKKKVNVTKNDGGTKGATLVELFVDGGKGKTSFHNRKYANNPKGSITWMVRDEQSLKSLNGNFDEKLNPKQAAMFIVKKIKEFEKKYQSDIKWWK